MKKIVSILLILVLCFSLCACSDNSNNNSDAESNPVHEKIKDAVNSRVTSELMIQYGATSISDITYYISDAGMSEDGYNQCEVTGKVTYKDKYGSSGIKKYEVLMEYYPEKGPRRYLSCSLFN